MSGSGPRISFAIPYFNGLHHLREAIESVLRQEEGDWELVVVDDHGPEPAEDLVASFDDARISYVRNERNLGLGGNWNRCLALTRAPLVTILHADDRLLPEYAGAVLSAAAAHPAVAAVFTDVFTIDSHGVRRRTITDHVKSRLPRPSADHVVEGDDGLAHLLFGNYIVCPTMCLRRALVGPAPFSTTLRFVPDWELTTRLLLQGQSLYALRRPLLEYRRHAGTETSRMTSDASRFAEEIGLMRQRAAECDERGLARSARTARRRTTVRGHLLLRATLDGVRGRRLSAREEWRTLWSDLRDHGDGLRVDHPDPQE